jgi:hypothetical protein
MDLPKGSTHWAHNAIAGQLNAGKVATANGGRWRHVQVRQILARASAGAGTPDVYVKEAM